MLYKMSFLILNLLNCFSYNSNNILKSKKLANFTLALDYKKSECKSIKKCVRDCIPKNPSVNLMYLIISQKNVQLSTVNNCSLAIMQSNCPFDKYPLIACSEILYPLKSKKKAEQFYLFDNKEQFKQKL